MALWSATLVLQDAGPEERHLVLRTPDSSFTYTLPPAAGTWSVERLNLRNIAGEDMVGDIVVALLDAAGQGEAACAGTTMSRA